MTDSARMTDLADRPSRPGWIVLAPLAGLLLAELLAVSLIYRHGFEFECRAALPAPFCAVLSMSVLRAISVGAALGLLLLARPGIRRMLGEGMRRYLSPAWTAVQVAGFALVLAPSLFLSDDTSSATLGLGVAAWLLGGALAVAGAGLMIAPAATWRTAVLMIGAGGAVAAGIAFLAPEIAAAAQWAWKWNPITVATFRAAEAILLTVGQNVVADPEIELLGSDGFEVLVGPQCSGVEGFLLISSFLGFCIWLFRERLRFPHVLILLPIGIVVSWCFNAVRISGLILIGAHVSPDLAMNGFHSHAGWLMFTVLALTLALTATRLAWFQKAEPVTAVERPRLPFLDDPVALMILPFIVFMATALLSQTFSETPGLLYPLRAAAMVAVLLAFRHQIAAMDWRIDPLAAGAGAAIGVAWLATAPAAGEGDLAMEAALAAMPPAVFALWALSRVIGTAVLVPLIEELFFRGYVLGKLDGPGYWRWVALAVSAGLFAALHDRWIAAALAGVIFGLLALRRGKLADAVWSHAAANAVIAAWALAHGDWAVI